MREKILSIIIPMYNSENFIEKALNSLIDTPSDDYEIIVINDGSTDTSPNLVHEYEQKFPTKVFLINQINNGHGSAINTAISRCNGRFFRVLDADDWIKTNSLEHFLQQLYKIESDIVATGYYTYNIQTNKQTLHDISFKKVNTPVDFQEIVHNWSNVVNAFTLHGITYKTSFYRSLPYVLPEKVYYDDACYVTLFSRHAQSITLLDTPIYVYRIGDVLQSVSDSSRVKRIDQLEKIIDLLIQPCSISISDVGMEFSRIKTISVITDYLITALIKFPNRRVGRKKALLLKEKILNNRADLTRYLNKRYYFLMVLHRLHVSSNSLTKIMNIYHKIL